LPFGIEAITENGDRGSRSRDLSEEAAPRAFGEWRRKSMPHIDQQSNSMPNEFGQSLDNLEQSKLPEELQVRLGQDAWGHVRSDHTWKDWVLIGKALLCIGRTDAMREAHTNAPIGKNYNSAFSAWLKRRGFDTIDQGDRSRLFEVLDHLEEIEAWRSKLTTTERPNLNHPSTVLRKFKSATAKPLDTNVPRKPSPMAKLKEALAVSEEENFRMRRELVRGSGDLWDEDDTTKNIAAAWVASIPSVSKVEEILREVRKILNEKKAALARAKSAKKVAEMEPASGGPRSAEPASR